MNKFSHVRFEPSGFTKNPDIPFAKSLTDYLFRFLGTRLLTREQKHEAGLTEPEPAAEPVPDRPPAPEPPAVAADRMEPRQTPSPAAHTQPTWQAQADAPSCADCGSIMIRNGSCYKCLDCGSTSGCS